MKINYGFNLAQSIGKRVEQQDKIITVPIHDPSDKTHAADLCIVADGMGGHVGGALASEKAAEAFATFFKRQTDFSNPPRLLREALEEANAEITRIIKSDHRCKGMGTTLIGLYYLIREQTFWYVSIGDSPLYLLENQTIRRINQNHAYYEELLEQVNLGKISLEEADNHPQRHAITSAVMGRKLELVDCPEKPFRLQPGNLVLMASDGLQTLDDHPGGIVESLLNSPEDLKTKLNNLLQAVEDEGFEYQDNTSLILLGDCPHEKKYNGKKTAAATKTAFHKKPILKKSIATLLFLCLAVSLPLALHRIVGVDCLVSFFKRDSSSDACSMEPAADASSDRPKPVTDASSDKPISAVNATSNEPEQTSDERKPADEK